MDETISPNTNLGHYRIVSKIGAGGMGEVYLAQDTTLDRKVALKILPADLAANQDRMRRFVQEAKAAAALNHPNIAHIYEIGESDGLNFIAMEFVDGVTLREKIHQERTELRKLLRFLHLPAFQLEIDYARLQDKDKAFEYLNKAYDQREPQIEELKVRLPFIFLRDDPRFKELVRKVGFPE